MKSRGLVLGLMITLFLFLIDTGLTWAISTSTISGSGVSQGTLINTSNAGAWNVFVGGYAGYSNTGGSNNTFLGAQSGEENTSGSGNVFIGSGAGLNEAGSNRLYIDNCYISNLASCDSPLIYGEFDNRLVRIDGELIMGPPPVIVSDGRLKQDVEPLNSSLEKIMRLRGVSFNWKPEKNAYAKGFGGKKQIGLIAQEVEVVLPDLVYTDTKGLKAVAYDKLGPLFIEAIKEQEKKIEERDAKIEKLEKALAIMEQRLASLEHPTQTVAIK